MPETLAQSVHTEKNTAGWMEIGGSNKGFVSAQGKENRNMYLFSLCAAFVTTALALFEWHLCHGAACLWHKLNSTEGKLFLCLRDSYSTHTLGPSPTGCAYLLCVCARVFVLEVMRLLDVAVFKPVFVCVWF